MTITTGTRVRRQPSATGLSRQEGTATGESRTDHIVGCGDITWYGVRFDKAPGELRWINGAVLDVIG